MSIDAPVADWVTIPDLYRDPFPIYERLRAEGGVHWVPAVGRYLITSYAAVHATELDQETFSANEQGSLQIRAMGHSMLRRDDPEHYRERRAWQPALRPGVVTRVWKQRFQEHADRLIDAMIAKGDTADLIWDFAGPFAAECLRDMIGLYNADADDLQRWSQTLIDATGNYADDPEVWARGERSFDEVDAALDEMLAWHAENPDESLLSSLLRVPEDVLPLEKIRANVKMTIGGGLNEPRDALGVAVWALLSHPEQRAAVAADPSLWPQVFDETIRWVAPIGLYSRQTTREVDLAGVRLPAGARLGICILSANRDESVWEAPDSFDVRREVKPHLAFSKGVHVCLGAWAARAQVAEVGLPTLFARLQGLELVPEDPARIGGWVFRGMLGLPVRWREGLPAGATGVVDRTREDDAQIGHPGPRVAIVGSGPAGCFTAQSLSRAVPGARIDVFDALPVPYGLVRYGVAADHIGTKSVSRQFDRLFTHEGVRFFGDVRIGPDLPLERLRAGYDAVVLATGLHADRTLPVPGARLPHVVGAGALTRALNGHPDQDEPAPLGEQVAVVGMGNVALDVVRLLARDVDDLAGSDVDDAVRARLTGAVRTVHVLGRTAPEAARFDPVMLRELGGLRGVEHHVHGWDAASSPEGKDARADAVRGLAADTRAVSLGASGQMPPRVAVHWWFGVTPAQIDAEAISIRTRDGERALPAQSIVTAIGFDADAGALIEPGAHPDGRVEAGLYTAGWLRTGPRGTIPDQRADARRLAGLIADDLAAGRIGTSGVGIAPPPQTIDFDGWRRIDLRERLGAAPGRERAKLRTRAELRAAASDPSLELPPVVEDAIATGSDGPAVTILFGTESGGAELVAEDLRRALGEAADVRDLDEVDAASLDRDRLHLVVCATYGDGEVPTGARGFLAELASGEVSLDGLVYAVFGMGDRSYTRTYSRGSELIDEALAACGARRIGEYGRHDAAGPIGAVEAAREWAHGVLAEVADRVG